MPFTFAHPAAVVPLRRLLGRFGVLSALVIGSMVPDFHNFLPFDLTREDTHSLPGVVWFCLPLGLLTYWLYHRLLRHPLASLLPRALGARLVLTMPPRLPSVPAGAVPASLLFGIVTHFIWDTFTHRDALGVALVRPLRRYLFSVGGVDIYVYKVLQHGSAVIGLALLAWWTVQWFRRTPVQVAALRDTDSLTARAKGWIVCLSMGAALLTGYASAMPYLAFPLDMLDMRAFVREFAVTAISTLGALVVAYSVLWHVARDRVD